MSHIAIVARITVKDGKANEYVAAFAPLLEQAVKEPGTLLYAVHRSKDDPRVFWTTEVYADTMLSRPTAGATCMPLPHRCSSN